ncbi:hypothetical protein NY884_02775, partial [Escherichia coli]
MSMYTTAQLLAANEQKFKFDRKRLVRT